MIHPSARSRLDMMGAYSIAFYVGIILVAWGVVAGFLLPPTSPSAGPDEIAELFREDTTRIRIGMVLTMFAALIVIPFIAVATRAAARVEGENGILTFSMLIGGVGLMILTFYPPAIWLAAAFRTDRDPALIQLFNDLAWLQFIGGVSMFLAMPLAVFGLGMLDSSDEPIFPRWFAYASVWVVVGIVCDQLLFFFHDGPFAWNGVIGFWIPLALFGGFLLLLGFVLRTAVLRERAHGGMTPDTVTA